MPSVSESTLRVSDSSKFGEFADSPCNALLWERRPPAGNQEFFQELLRYPVGCKFEVVANQARQAVEAHLVSVLPEPLRREPLFEAWVSDLVELIAAYATAHRLERVVFHLDTDRPCQRFHADTLIMRLACTYCGPGTVWLTEDNVHRQAAETRGTTNKEIVIDPSRIQQLGEWDVLVMKGKRATNTPLYHKSPDPRAGDPPSLILKLDEPDPRISTPRQ